MKSYQVRIASGIRSWDHATRERETDTHRRAVVGPDSHAVKGKNSGRKHAKQGPVGVKKSVSV